ncbi:hypothetical protein [Exiguobacterium sp.]|uniref:hypothetical protein n=1 Tax=Exiguobacterium sp. TaxID=44751 RepID=UPI0025C2899E|nr:hypothetical protein [Exiguobacterium sp.]
MSGLMIWTIVKAVMLSYRKQQLSISKAIFVILGMVVFSILLAGVLPYLYFRFL